MSLDERIAALMQREVDGVNSEAEQAELQRYLGGHPEARQQLEQLAAVTDALNSLPEVDPPADLRTAIRGLVGRELQLTPTPERVRRARASARADTANTIKETPAMTAHRGLHTRRQWTVVGLAAAAALAGVAAVGYLGWMAPPASDGTAGTIGAVQKYRAPQIGDADVVLAGQETRVPHESVLEGAVALQRVAAALESGSSDPARAREAVGQRFETVRARLRHQMQVQRDALATFTATHGSLYVGPELQLGPTPERAEARSLRTAVDQLQAAVVALAPEVTGASADPSAVTSALEKLAALDGSGTPNETELEALTAELEAAAVALAVRDAQLDYGLLVARQRHLDLLLEEMAALAAADRDLGTADGAAGERLESLGATLGARAERLANVGTAALQARFGAMSVGMNGQVEALGPPGGASVWLSFNQAQLEAAQQALASQTEALGAGGASVWLSFNQAQLAAAQQALASQTEALGIGTSSVWISFNRAQLAAAQQALGAQVNALGPEQTVSFWISFNRAQLAAAQQALASQTEALGIGTSSVWISFNRAQLEASQRILADQVESLGPDRMAWLQANQAQLEASQQALASQTEALGAGTASVWLSFNQAQLAAAQQGLAAQTAALGPAGSFAFVTLNRAQLAAARQALEAQTTALGWKVNGMITQLESRLESMSLKASDRWLGLQTTLGAIAPLEASGLGATATLGAMRSALENQAQP